MSTLAIQHLKYHFPVLKNIVTFGFLAIIPRCFAWEYRSRIRSLQFMVDSLVEMPIKTTGTFPELY